MITFFFKATLLSLTSIVILISNPVKMSMLLLAVSLVLFTLMALTSGGVWFPTLFALLFMGGILMMFMILSSILPNEKSMKIKILSGMIVSSTILSYYSQKFSESNCSFGNTKSLLSSSLTFYFIILILMLYFFSVISMLSKEESPMRMTLCCKKINFVN